MSLCFIHLSYSGCLFWHTHAEQIWLALCVSNQTNRLRRREVRTLGRMATKSEGDNMVCVLCMNDGFPGPTPSQHGPQGLGCGQDLLLPEAGCHAWGACTGMGGWWLWMAESGMNGARNKEHRFWKLLSVFVAGETWNGLNSRTQTLK